MMMLQVRSRFFSLSKLGETVFSGQPFDWHLVTIAGFLLAFSSPAIATVKIEGDPRSPVCLAQDQLPLSPSSEKPIKAQKILEVL